MAELAEDYPDLLRRAMRRVKTLAGAARTSLDSPPRIAAPAPIEPIAANGQGLSAEVIRIIDAAIRDAAAASTLGAALEIGYRAFAATACTAAARKASPLSRRNASPISRRPVEEPLMKVNKIDHICIAVRNLEQARKVWEPILGKSAPDDAYVDEPEKIRVARYWVGEVGFELMESLTPTATSRSSSRSAARA